ncbi:hypothetical protein WKT02_04645 [Erysipelotrichaceae bacterium HCN-30851]
MNSKKTILGSMFLAVAMLVQPLQIIAADGDMGLTFEGDSGEFITYETESAFENLTPGEERVQQITLRNDDYREMKFYVRSELDSVGAGETTENIAYEIEFSNDGEVFYSGTIGGTTQANMDSLDTNYLLDTLAQGETETIDIAIRFDGDSMDNSYQGKIGNLNLIFSVEYEENTPIETVVEVVKQVPVINQIVQTGGMTALGLLLGVFTASIIAVIVLLVTKRRKKEEGQNEHA